MSKLLMAILLMAFASLLILQLFNNSLGQDISAIVTLDPAIAAATVKGRFNNSDDIANRRNLSFLREYAGIEELGERLSGVLLTDGDGQDVEYRQMIPGEILADGPFINWRYHLDLTPPRNPSASAHVSWLGEDLGIIFLDDLLPQLSDKNAHPTADVKFDLPKGWQLYSTEKKAGEFAFESVNIEKAVFLIGRNLRERTISAGGPPIKIVIGGDWQFSDDEASTIAKEIYSSYRQLFGADAMAQAQIAIMKLPVVAGPGSWEADTRGASLTILSSDMPFKTQSLQRLHEQLRHEIFHLWIPNGINLSGNYDWFYEGFALYISLKSGVMMNRIRFDDFLDTLSRAHTIESFQSPRLSLIDASQKRWSGGNTTVYARGMIAAFLCDLALLRNSKGKTSVSDVLKEIFERYRAQKTAVDGTDAVLGMLGAHPELRPILEKYVKGNSAVDWAADLAAAGIASDVKNSVTVLKTVEKPTGRRRALLEKLGYNSWRKLWTGSR